MIKILLKHYIYEMCIEVMFKPLILTFSPQSLIPTTNVKVGYKYSAIYIISEEQYFYNCTINSILPTVNCMNFDNDNYNVNAVAFSHDPVKTDDGKYIDGVVTFENDLEFYL